MKKIRLNLLLVVLTLLLLGGCCSSSQKIVIISTNDMHSEIDEFPRLASLVKEYRSQEDVTVFLVDAGDRITGNPYVDVAAHNGRPIYELMNLLEYDVATFGNHEFDKGIDTLVARINDAEFDIVLANIQTGKTTLAQPEPYVIKRVGCTKIGFIGFITNYATGGLPDGDAASFKGLTFPSVAETGKKYQELHEECDVLIALSHLGANKDTTDLIAAMPNLDLIVSGHTHEIVNKKVKDVAVIQSKKSLSDVGITVITLENKEIVSIESSIVSLKDYPLDPEYQKLVKEYNDRPEFKVKVGSVTEDMPKYVIANIFSDVIRKDTKSDFGFYNIGGVRVDKYEKGDIRVADIYRVEPFISKGEVLEMTPEQIKQMIINKFNDTKNVKEAFKRDLYPSGLEYTIITNNKGFATDVILYPEVKKDSYRVALSNYVFKNYLSKKDNESLEKSKLVTDLLFDYFKENSPVMPNLEERITIKKN